MKGNKLCDYHVAHLRNNLGSNIKAEKVTQTPLQSAGNIIKISNRMKDKSSKQILKDGNGRIRGLKDGFSASYEWLTNLSVSSSRPNSVK
jgi:hypothetical protein